MKRMLVSVMVVLLAGIFPARANLIMNGDFEEGNTAFLSELVYSPGDITPPTTYDIVLNPADSHYSCASYTDHTGGGYMLAANGSLEPDDIVWSQTVEVQENTLYELAFWLSSWSSLDSPVIVLDVVINGSNVLNSCNVPPTGGVWEHWSTVWFSGNSESAEIDFINTSTKYYGCDFAIDDISLVIVPEPTTLLLLGLGAAMVRRRRSQSLLSRS
ncbi:MAG: PEP-CTERM sorting domain-containing protein [Phycisphaerales bacterium]|nr:MAG: PEP-CTERM sorting domain-containing protein [Phycisphaerales bacterium]